MLVTVTLMLSSYTLMLMETGLYLIVLKSIRKLCMSPKPVAMSTIFS